jgi:hypothetical protein
MHPKNNFPAQSAVEITTLSLSEATNQAVMSCLQINQQSFTYKIESRESGEHVTTSPIRCVENPEVAPLQCRV